MCHGFVRFAIRRDRRRRLLFAPINGETWQSSIEGSYSADTETVHLLRDGDVYQRSGAVCRVLFEFGGIWKALGCALWLIPCPLRNLGYRFVAAIRHRIAGKVDACTLPDPDAVERMLP